MDCTVHNSVLFIGAESDGKDDHCVTMLYNMDIVDVQRSRRIASHTLVVAVA